MAYLTITGNTFPVKDAIKALGGRWNPTAKGWDVPFANAKAAQALVTGAPKQAFTAVTQRPTGSARYYGRSQGRPCGYPGCNGRNFCEECSE